MIRKIIIFLFLLFISGFSQNKMRQFVLEPCVTVKSNNGIGSGTIFIKNNIAYVLTAAHVIEANQKIKDKYNKKDKKYNTIETFDDAFVSKNLYENGRRVGKIEYNAKIVEYSEEEDLALLKIRKRSIEKYSAILFPNTKIPEIGQDVYHCGSRYGEIGSSSLTAGIISTLGIILDNKIFDQTTSPASPGSSGGCVFLRYNLSCIGIITRGNGDTFNFFIPSRRIWKWLKNIKKDYIFK